LIDNAGSSSPNPVAQALFLGSRMKVSRYNYAAQFPEGFRELMTDLEQMLVNGAYVLSSEVTAFENAYAAYHGARFAKGVNSGTDALTIALSALDLKPGDEVITHANTFNATVTAIILAGARPVLVDADEQSFLINADQIESEMSARTKAIVPVHLFGKPTPMEPILELASRHGLFVVEDAAQAHGARWHDRCVGSFGNVGCFSFHPSKNLAAAGDGGAVITSDEALAQAIDEIRSLGQRGQNNHVRMGCNSKLDAIQARVLSAKLVYLDRWNAARRKIAAAYRDRLQDLPVGFQSQSASEEHVYHLFQIRTTKRDALRKHLVSAGVDAIVRYPQPIHLQPVFASFNWRRGTFPVSEALARELLCLPIRPDLTEVEIDYVCTQIRSFFSGT
jgi:dTDP-4-amino-4,6-dideoxygalactose transaminase